MASYSDKEFRKILETYKKDFQAAQDYINSQPTHFIRDSSWNNDHSYNKHDLTKNRDQLHDEFVKSSFIMIIVFVIIALCMCCCAWLCSDEGGSSRRGRYSCEF